MNGIFIAAIVVASIAAYMVAGYFTGRTYARHCYSRGDGGYGESFRQESAVAAFWCAGLFWPIMAPWVLARRYIPDLSIATIIPEIAEDNARKRARELEREAAEREREIARLERQILNQG